MNYVFWAEQFKRAVGVSGVFVETDEDCATLASALERAERMQNALQLWKCNRVGGCRGRDCQLCEGSGLHPIAREALKEEVRR